MAQVVKNPHVNAGAAAAAAAAKSLQSCPTLCDPIDGSPPGSPVPGILPARTLEWAAISFSNAWKWKVKVKLFSSVRLFTTPWTAAYQPPVHGIFQTRVLEWVATAFSSMQETGVQFLGWEDPWRRKWQPTPVFLPGQFHQNHRWQERILEFPWTEEPRRLQSTGSQKVRRNWAPCSTHKICIQDFVLQN